MKRIRVAAHNAHDQKAAVAEATGLADLVLWSEAVVVKAPGWTFARGGKGVVTGWRTDLFAGPVTSRWHQAHRGRTFVTPARGSLVTKGALATGHLFAVVNGHRINGTGWEGVRRRTFAGWRRDRWREHHRMDRTIVAELAAAGYAVLLGSDVNRIGMPSPHPNAVALRHGGITQLWLIRPNDGPRVRVGKGGAVAGLARGSSHRLQWRDLILD